MGLYFGETIFQDYRYKHKYINKCIYIICVGFLVSVLLKLFVVYSKFTEFSNSFQVYNFI